MSYKSKCPECWSDSVNVGIEECSVYSNVNQVNFICLSCGCKHQTFKPKRTFTLNLPEELINAP
jgi:hypothetical protein